MRRVVTLAKAVMLPFACGVVLSACATSENKTVLGLVKGSLNLDGLVHNERYNCSQTFTGGSPFCADTNVSDQIQFTKTGTDAYQIRDVPDTGYLSTGTLRGLKFTRTATRPNGYTESGISTFSADGSTFSASSHYVANDNSYSGDCRESGARAPATPAPPAAVGPCP